MLLKLSFPLQFFKGTKKKGTKKQKCFVLCYHAKQKIFGVNISLIFNLTTPFNITFMGNKFVVRL
jgi:hypothetical protein